MNARGLMSRKGGSDEKGRGINGEGGREGVVGSNCH